MELVSYLYYEDSKIIPFNEWIIHGNPHHSFMWRSIIYAIPVSWKCVFKKGFTTDKCIKKGSGAVRIGH